MLLGIQPTGRIHIGNYFGVLEKGLELNARILVAQYHANCSNDKAIEFCDTIRKLGFTDVYMQTHETLELFYKLAHSQGVGELERLPQYQTKEQTLHMLSYPLLMACDIIVSGEKTVIVGEDQGPHMHYYREVARKNKYKIADSFILPDRQIKSIKDPTKKMSKSLGDDHCIYLDDTFEDINRKISKSPTTPEGIAQLKKIAGFIGSEFDEKESGKYKEILSFDLYSFLQRVLGL